MLILFDIDATLITTKGVGIAAMIDAGRRLHGPGFHAEGIEFAGRLDPLILRDMLCANGLACSTEAMIAMRHAYRDALVRRLAPGGVARSLPGVLELLASLGTLDDRVTLGLLTGNFSETGSLKLQAAGIDPQGFPVRVWGDESPHEPPAREHLPGIAIERVAQRWGRPCRGEEVVVIGDTPHDIACARAHGCRVLAVATGKFSAAELAHADRVVPDLSDVEGVQRWLTG
ncbi:MAG TPA: HAD hydrolase-like protein [Phycisphaerales bacterium]|nr:HAD hydrolase-like protein [Phycisphaerales bacterium]